MRLFITGTDTGVGKTVVSAGLVRALAGLGQRVIGMKPVATGAVPGPHGLRNQDAIDLLHAGNVEVTYADVNPFAYAPPIAPHLAAAATDRPISIALLAGHIERLALRCDTLIVEGIGGWRVPLGPAAAMPDLVIAARLPVVLVVGVRLGCINHALLTADAVRHDGLKLCGWIANLVGDVASADAIVQAIDERIGCPRLASLPHLPASAIAAATPLLQAAAARLLQQSGAHQT